MKLRKMFMLSVLLLIAFAVNNTTAQTVPEIAENAIAATVMVEGTVSPRQQAYGSGFFISETHIVTNYHVIENSSEITVRLVNTRHKYSVESVISIDKDNDLAILKIKSPQTKMLTLGDSTQVKIGEDVYVAGNPRSFEGTFSKGTISGIRKHVGLIQITAPISKGSSGGPVLNGNGQVIGVATYISLLKGQNLNFMVPVEYVKSLFDTRNENRNYAKILEYNRKIESNPKDVNLYILRGIEYVLLLQDEDAIADFDEAIRLDPDRVSAYHLRGLAYIRFKKYQFAWQDFTQVILRDPTNTSGNLVDAYYFRGQAEFELGQHEDAMTDFNMAIKLDPTNGDAHFCRGEAKFELGQYKAAIRDFDLAILFRATVTEVFAYKYRAMAKMELGLYAAAISDYDVVIDEFDSKDPMVYYNVGLCLSKLGMIHTARFFLNRAREVALKQGEMKTINKIDELLEQLKE